MDEPLSAVASLQEAVTSLISLLSVYGGWAIFVAVLLTGETAIFVAFMLAEQGTISFSLVFIMAALATLVADLFWFTAGRYVPPGWLPTRFKNSLAVPVGNVLTRIFRGRQFLPILLLKFFIGTRIVVLIYFARQAISYARFFIYNIISIVFYLAVLALFGILFGRAIEVVVPAYKTTVAVVTGILVVVLISHLVRAKLRDR